jgi:uncharacterized protein (DUF302 family)
MLNNENGIIHQLSSHSVDDTMQRLLELLHAKGITLFAMVDHSGEAEKVGLKMPPTKLAIFGNPRGGTPVMLAAPTSALDLPLKILVWQDAEGAVWLSFNSAEFLQARHGIPAEFHGLLAGVGDLAAAAAK